MKLDHVLRPTARLYLLILLIGLLLGSMLPLSALPAHAQDSGPTPAPTVTPTETPAPTAEPLARKHSAQSPATVRPAHSFN